MHYKIYPHKSTYTQHLYVFIVNQSSAISYFSIPIFNSRFVPISIHTVPPTANLLSTRVAPLIGFVVVVFFCVNVKYNIYIVICTHAISVSAWLSLYLLLRRQRQHPPYRIYTGKKTGLTFSDRPSSILYPFSPSSAGSRRPRAGDHQLCCRDRKPLSRAPDQTRDWSSFGVFFWFHHHHLFTWI